MGREEEAQSLRRWFGLMLVLSLAGCGTVFNMGAGPCAINDGYPRIYGGVRIDVTTIAPQLIPLGFLLALIDFPFTLVGDTITLPWSITATLEHGKPRRATDAERKAREERSR